MKNTDGLVVNKNTVVLIDLNILLIECVRQACIFSFLQYSRCNNQLTGKSVGSIRWLYIFGRETF